MMIYPNAQNKPRTIYKKYRQYNIITLLMKILHIETSSKNCSVAISDGEDLLCLCEEVSENYKQSENLHTFIQWTLEGAEIQLKDLQGISLGRGPGSYTGLRIGAASAKGFCFGLNIPLVAVNSMESMILPFLNQGFDLIIPLIDARRMEVYTAVYDGNSGAEKSATTNMILNESSFLDFNDKNILFVGDGSSKAKEILNLNNAEYKETIFPSAEYLVKPALKKIISKDFEDIAYFEPFYLKDFQGLKKNERK